MRYNMIMKGMRGWRIILLAWIFCFCMGVIVYASTNLIENHECTYVFSVVKVIIFTIINQRNKWKIRLLRIFSKVNDEIDRAVENNQQIGKYRQQSEDF